MKTFQRYLDETERRLSFRVPIVSTSGLIKPILAVGFRLDDRDDLGTGLHQFGIGQHTTAARKVLKARADQHKVIAGGGYTPSLSDTVTLTAPDDISLPVTLAIVRGSHA